MTARPNDRLGATEFPAARTVPGDRMLAGPSAAFGAYREADRKHLSASPPGPGDQAPAGTVPYVACGALQLLAFLAAVFAGAAVACGGYRWVCGSHGLAGLCLRSLAVGAGIFALLCGLPIAAKWTLVGRWKPREIPLWSLTYLRFWLVKTLVAASPLALFTGSPVYSMYLRALGAKVGRRVVIFSRTVPVCTDLLAIGDDTVIRKESSFTGYRATGGVIQTGPVSIGRNALIGEHTVLDIGTSVGDGSQLGHTSALHESQAVPDGERWHGSPAQPAAVNDQSAGPLPCGWPRRTAYGSMQLPTPLCVTLPLALCVTVPGLTKVPAVASLAASLAASGAGGLATARFYEEGLAFSTAAFFCAVLLGGAAVLTAPRLLSFRVTPLPIGPRNFRGSAVACPAADRFDHPRTRTEFRRRLSAKNRHNVETMGLFLAVRWFDAFIVTLFCMGARELFSGSPVLVLGGLTIATLLFNFAFFVTVERALMRFGSLRPRHCSIYHPYFWWHERYWMLMTPLIGMFNGTPVKGLIWRLLGVRIGRRVFDDGCGIPERTLVAIGDYCTLNAGTVIQCHSMEDGIFNSDYTVIEDGCTVGTGAFVHYGVTMGPGVQLRPGSFLTQGEKVPRAACWGGNPARAL